MRIFKNAWFERFARKQRITDRVLHDAIERAEKGLIDADLGGGVIKQRVARQGQGKSGGYRTIVLYKTTERAFFIYGFSKSDRENIDQAEETEFKKAACHILSLTEEQIMLLIDKGQLTEVFDE
ncbi:type II toxin-antitoxin system RelE/ParE family toxin [Salmonella enterica subsp. enterica serovar Javiana]|nr:type II toxin-antitoxin system RelE/ParE family toxin [Salmonella enterica subsp. enterica serovar Javiana]EDA0235352.1 type II toxin-antitoxin system RelE/ParE family toxin [Salmonella enterica]EEK4999029.1 type II toxin-antitoxin system RelE/ParE family toxin [Salmonella enterica]EFB0086429.1 type II toxin-antitoxin system RelE/ParE family toxin [Salmonella enterica]